MSGIGYWGIDPQTETGYDQELLPERCEFCGTESEGLCPRCYPKETDPCFNCEDECEQCKIF